MNSPRETWSTDKSFNEVVELIPHMRALDIGTVWVESGPSERVTSVSASRTIYNGAPVGVELCVLVEGIDIRWSVDLVRYGAGTGDEFDVDAVSTLLQQLPPKPRASFAEILDGRLGLLDQQMGRLSSDTAKLVGLKDALTQLRARNSS